MRNSVLLLVFIIALLTLLSCTTHHDPAQSQSTPVVTPAPGADGYYSVNGAGVAFKWKVNGTNLDCKVSAGTTGWVAAGFNSSAAMAGSDIKIGYVTGGANAFMSDDYAPAYYHTPDTVQNMGFFSGSDNGTTTELIFQIPLDSGDSSQDFKLVQGSSLWLTLARGADGTDNFTVQHAAMTAVQITLY